MYRCCRLTAAGRVWAGLVPLDARPRRSDRRPSVTVTSPGSPDSRASHPRPSVESIGGKLQVSTQAHHTAPTRAIARLALARTSYFAILERTWAGGRGGREVATPRLVCSLIEI